VIDDLEAGPIEAIWKPGGASTTAGGDQVIWGYFYADPARVSWGSPENPALFVKTRLASSGAAQVEYLHAAVPDIQVSSDYPYDGRPDLQSTTRRTSRYLEHSYAGGVTSNGRIRQAIADPLGMRLAAGFGVSLGGGYPGPAADLIGAQWANGLGARPGGYPGRVDPTGVELANDLRIGALIDTAERGPIEAAWRPGGAATTARGDQVVWGYFYADPAQVSGGSPDIPDLFVKVWYDLGGAVDVDFFHLSVRDIEVYSELPNNGSYDHRGVTAPGNRFVEHRYQR